MTRDHFVAECREFLDCNAPRRTGQGGGAPTLGRAALFKSRAEEEATIPAARRYRAAKFDAGFGWISGPTRYGGRGLDAGYEACFDEIEAEYDVPNEDCFAPGLEYVGPIVLEFGGDELRDALLPRLYRGDAIACQLFSEPDAGSDLASLRTEARRDGSVWHVNGQKIWTSRAHFSDVGLLLTRTGAADSRHHGISAFVVDMHTPGVTVQPLRQMTGDAPFNEVFLDDVPVPDSHRLGDVDGGWRVAMSTLGRERAALARRHRHRPDGLVEIAAPTRVAEVLRGCGLADDPCRRQQWARVYTGQTVMHLTNERLGAAPAGAVADAARAMGKLMLARNLSYAAGVIASALGCRVAADTGEAWASRWLPFVLGVPALHIGGGTDEMVLNSIGERVLGLPGPHVTSVPPGVPGPLHVAAHARREPDKPAIVMAGSGETVTYGELDRRSTQLARVFADMGCRRGDHVAILLENHPRFAEVCWAAHRTGLYYTPINRQLTASEAAGIVDDCGARVLVTSAALRDTASALADRCAGLRSRLMLDGVSPGFERYEDALAARSDSPLDEETEGSAMIYSSGTTGRPKGIRRPASGRPPGTTLFGVDPSVADAYGLTRESRALVPVPLYHSSGLTRLMMCLCIGATVVLMARFDAEAALVAIERHGVTLGLFVPTMLVRMLRLDPVARARHDVSTMTAATLGSGPCPPAVKAAVIEWWGPIVTETYGGTEGNGMTRITATEWLAHPGSVGRPVFGEVHVVGPDGRELGPGESGVVYFSGGRAFEYHNDPAKTAAAHDQRGWSTLGDVGHVDADGYLYITDRVTDMIISGAVNIYPREVEDVLLAHPDVEDVAVIGVPNEEFGEEVKAIVKPRHGVAADEALRGRLLEHARASLARYKCPRTVDFVEEFPRQDTGKVYKRLLREPYWAGREPEPSGSGAGTLRRSEAGPERPGAEGAESGRQVM